MVETKSHGDGHPEHAVAGASHVALTDCILATVKEVAFNITLVTQYIFLKYCFIIFSSSRQQHITPPLTKLSRVDLICFSSVGDLYQKDRVYNQGPSQYVIPQNVSHPKARCMIGL